MTKYRGKLDAPLPPSPSLLTSEDYLAEEAAFQREIKERLNLLFEHYGISPGAVDAWQSLAVALAKSHVPGLKPHHRLGDPDRAFSVFFRMYFLVELEGISESQSAKVVSAAFPDLGKAEAIRSTYREFEFHPQKAHMINLFARIRKELGKEQFQAALGAAIGEDVSKLEGITPQKRGRPKG